MSTRTPVAAGVAGLVTLLALGWVGLVLYYDVAAPLNMKMFSAVVATGQPIREFREAEVQREWTLFQEGGRQHALRPFAERAFEMDSWDGEMRYVFARALWREYNTPANPSGRTPGGFLREELPDSVVTYLRMAIRRDPANCFYRSTLAGVLRTIEPRRSEVKPEVRRLLLCYPPQDTYGLIRTAEMLAAEGEDKRLVLADYSRGLSFLSTEVGSGLLDTSVSEPGQTVFPALAPRLVNRVVTDLLRDIGTYDLWAPVLPDYPEARWFVAADLRARVMGPEADKEYAKVLESVQRRLALERTRSSTSMVFEFLCPLQRPGQADRLLLTREIGMAASVIRTSRPEEAIELFRMAVSRSPMDVGPRLALGDLLLERAALLKAAAKDFRDKGDAAKAAQADNQAESLYREVDQQASAILERHPLLGEALNLRSRIPKRTPEGAAP